MNVTDLDQRRLFGDEEDVTFEEEEVTLNGFEVSLETWMSVSAKERRLSLPLWTNEPGKTFGSCPNR